MLLSKLSQWFQVTPLYFYIVATVIFLFAYYGQPDDVHTLVGFMVTMLLSLGGADLFCRIVARVHRDLYEAEFYDNVVDWLEGRVSQDRGWYEQNPEE